MTTLPPPMPLPLLEAMLHQAPLDVLLFDTDLICRYAAPASGSLFGQRSSEIVGQTAVELFSPENGDLHTALRLAAETAASYDYAAYRYTHRDAETQTHFCWSVRIEPVLLRDYRGLDEFRGVLVTLTDVQDLADAKDRLEAEVAELREEMARLHEEQRETQGRISRGVREALAPVTGYLQVISRRPRMLGTRSAVTVIESVILPNLQRAVEALEDGAEATPRTRRGRPT